MNTTTDLLWLAKLDARLHDPIEKVLVLMRTAAGHEGGTTRKLRERLFVQPLPAAVRAAVRKADHWASAADRAAFPNHEDDHRYPDWQQVRFHEQPVLIHPLTGTAFELEKLRDVEPEAIADIAFQHFSDLIHDGDLRATALAFWRFGPELDNRDFRHLWKMLPADSRVPDHTIWDHLDLTAAFATAFAADSNQGPALMAVSIGPVQDFIEASRSTSDLWAGSHFLSRLAWEAMRIICDELGPEAILFPRLRGIPQVDLWLRDACGLPAKFFDHREWVRARTDANPLFTAALPNRFTALVPASRAKAIGEAITSRLRAFTLAQGREAYRLLLEAAGIDDDESLPGYAQLASQLAGFPEVHWAAVPWSLVGEADGKVDLSDGRLAAALAPFYAEPSYTFLESDLWKLLSKNLEIDKGRFWAPNPGALYPALYELLERLLAATKSLRPFEQNRQEGWRCSLTGETEWLTTEREQLKKSPRENEGTLWNKVAKKKPSWAKRGEHLGALSALKRLWPELYRREVEDLLDKDISRFVVSTHTMSMVPAIKRLLDQHTEGERKAELEQLVNALKRKDLERAALPARLLWRKEIAEDVRQALLHLPALLDQQEEDEEEGNDARRLLKNALGHAPETYYAMLLMDGDHMGAWVAAGKGKTLAHRETFHPAVRAALDQRFGQDENFARYAISHRAGNPARHMTISDALNNFALKVVPEVVDQHYGKVLYAGGDDVLAMLPVTHALEAARELRERYSGESGDASRARNGFFRGASGEVLRMMGEKATASAGLVIAHHKAPLQFVLGALRTAEKRAKSAGRDRISITLIKRSGGTTHLSLRWEELSLLGLAVKALNGPETSRRAAYNVQLWIRDLPDPASLQKTSADGAQRMLSTLLGYQFGRQGMREKVARPLAEQLSAYALATNGPLASQKGADAAKAVADRLTNLLTTAEFLARDTRG